MHSVRQEDWTGKAIPNNKDLLHTYDIVLLYITTVFGNEKGQIERIKIFRFLFAVTNLYDKEDSPWNGHNPQKDARETAFLHFTLFSNVRRASCDGLKAEVRLLKAGGQERKRGKERAIKREQIAMGRRLIVETWLSWGKESDRENERHAMGRRPEVHSWAS